MEAWEREKIGGDPMKERTRLNAIWLWGEKVC